jgi:hypothetical protein
MFRSRGAGHCTAAPNTQISHRDLAQESGSLVKCRRQTSSSILWGAATLVTPTACVEPETSAYEANFLAACGRFLKFS